MISKGPTHMHRSVNQRFPRGESRHNSISKTDQKLLHFPNQTILLVEAKKSVCS